MPGHLQPGLRPGLHQLMGWRYLPDQGSAMSSITYGILHIVFYILWCILHIVCYDLVYWHADCWGLKQLVFHRACWASCASRAGGEGPSITYLWIPTDPYLTWLVYIHIYRVYVLHIHIIHAYVCEYAYAYIYM